MNLTGIKTICSKSQELPNAITESGCETLVVKVDLDIVSMKLEGSYVDKTKAHMTTGQITTLGFIDTPLSQVEVENFVLKCIEELKSKENDHLLIITLNTFEFKYPKTDGSIAFVSFVINDSFQVRNFVLSKINGEYILIPPTRANKKSDYNDIVDIIDKSFEKLLIEKAVRSLSTRKPISFMYKSKEKLFTVSRLKKYVSQNMVGFADIVMFGLLKINGTRILKGEGYLYLSYPSEKKEDGSYLIYAYPFDKDLKAAIQKYTLEKLKEQQVNGEF